MASTDRRILVAVLQRWAKTGDHYAGALRAG